MEIDLKGHTEVVKKLAKEQGWTVDRFVRHCIFRTCTGSNIGPDFATFKPKKDEEA